MKRVINTIRKISRQSNALAIHSTETWCLKYVQWCRESKDKLYKNWIEKKGRDQLKKKIPHRIKQMGFVDMRRCNNGMFNAY